MRALRSVPAEVSRRRMFGANSALQWQTGRSGEFQRDIARAPSAPVHHHPRSMGRVATREAM